MSASCPRQPSRIGGTHPPNAATLGKLPNHRCQREDSEWVAALSGKLGNDVQYQVHQELSNYLSVVVQNYLLRRQPDYLCLTSLAYEEVRALTQDFVQISLEKLSRNEYALLDQFSGSGSFKGWVSQMALNVARSELRKVRWDRLQPLDGLPFVPASRTPGPEQVFQQRQLRATLEHCLDQLPEHYRAVLVRCVMNGERTVDVARDLERSSQAVYNLVSRAKKELGALLIEAQVSQEDLTVFMIS